VHKQLNLKKINKINGVSLIELLLTVAILGILLGLSLPNFQNFFESTSTNSEAKIFLTTLNLARSEAITRGEDVLICASDDATDCNAGTWSDGWIVFVDTNGDADGDAGSIDTGSGDTVIRVFERGSNNNTFTANLFAFDELGYSTSVNEQTLKVCPPSNNADNARSIEIGATGRGRRIETGLACP